MFENQQFGTVIAFGLDQTLGALIISKDQRTTDILDPVGQFIALPSAV